MKRIKHRNIVRYHDSFVQGDYLYLVMEFCDRGDLGAYIQRLGREMGMGELRVWRFLLQILAALQYIHKLGIVHGDLKPQNILLTGRDYEVKLADFGISQALEAATCLYEGAGSLSYCAPEVLNGDAFNQKVDVWALGCILYEMITQKAAFVGSGEEQVKQSILSRNLPKINENQGSSELRTICRLCMERDPEKRPTI